MNTWNNSVAIKRQCGHATAMRFARRRKTSPRCLTSSVSNPSTSQAWAQAPGDGRGRALQRREGSKPQHPLSAVGIHARHAEGSARSAWRHGAEASRDGLQHDVCRMRTRRRKESRQTPVRMHGVRAQGQRRRERRTSPARSRAAMARAESARTHRRSSEERVVGRAENGKEALRRSSGGGEPSPRARPRAHSGTTAVRVHRRQRLHREHRRIRATDARTTPDPKAGMKNGQFETYTQ